MASENKHLILAEINKWWEGDRMPEMLCEATVVSIFKNGKTEIPENYRPISLLNCIYKIIAMVLKWRIEAGIDKYLQTTQCGFRANHSTSQAIHILRRVMDNFEKSGEQCILVLLDWENAFDKVLHHKLFEAMARMKIDPHLIANTKALYANPIFNV